MKNIVILALFGALILLLGCAQQQENSSQIGNSQELSGDAQKVSVRALNTGFYDKSEILVKAGQPVQFTFSADKDSGCGRQLLIPSFGVNLISQNGESKTVTFTPQNPGTYEYHCGMKMFRGKIIAK